MLTNNLSRKQVAYYGSAYNLFLLSPPLLTPPPLQLAFSSRPRRRRRLHPSTISLDSVHGAAIHSVPGPPRCQGRRSPHRCCRCPGAPGPTGAAVFPPPPGTDMTGICFRDQLWLNTYLLDRNLVFDYFALSPFYDLTCNNETLRSRQIHPLDMSHLTKMTRMEYVLSDVMEPHLFVIRKQRRESPEKSYAMLSYYILDGSIYQAPQLCSVFASHISRAMHHTSKAFTTACSKLEKIRHVEAETDTSASEFKTQKEAIDLNELKRVDHILMSLQRKVILNFLCNEHLITIENLLCLVALCLSIFYYPWTKEQSCV